MLNRLNGKLLLSVLLIVLFAKAATSFPRSPLELDINTSVALGSDLLTSVVEEGEPLLSSDRFSAQIGSIAGNMLPQCETPEDVFQSLNAERLLLEQKKQELADREAEVALAREKIDIEKDALVELKSAVEGLLSRVEAQQTEDLERLIALYRNMKPADAATIMNDLDIEVMIMVLGEMEPRVAAPILAKMSPVRAGAVSKIILERSKLPGDQNLNSVNFD